MATHTNTPRANNDTASEATHIDEPLTQPLSHYQSIVGPTSDYTFDDSVNLPYRSLSHEANLEEYTQETIDGQILKEVKSNATGRIERYELVTWKIDDPENPKNWSKPYKWWCTMCVALTCFVVAFNSAVITADIGGLSTSVL